MSFRGFVWKNAARNRRRTILTVLSIGLALFVLSTLVAIVNQFQKNLDESNDLRLIVRHKVSLANPMPERFGSQMNRIPGVVAAVPMQWFGGFYIDKAHTDFAQFGCEAETLFKVYTGISIPADQKEAFIKERTGAIIGKSKAEKHKLKVGDRITLTRNIFPVDLELTIRGIFTGTVNDEAAVFFHRDYLEELLGRPGNVGHYWVLVDSPDSVARVSEAIDSTFQNTDAPTKTETERAFQLGFISMLGNLNTLIATIGGVVIFTILLVTANTMAMSVRERVREIAVLKALGFGRFSVLALLMSEGVVITLAGGVLGCIGARLLFSSVDLAAFTQGFLQVLDVSVGTITTGLVISVVIGLVATGLPALRATRLTVAEGLRYVG